MVFAVRIVLRQCQEIVEVEGRLRPRSLEGLDIISVPTFVTKLQGVSTADVGQHIAPVVVVLNEIPLCETHTKRLSSFGVDTLDRDRRNRVVLRSAAQYTLDPVRPEDSFVRSEEHTSELQSLRHLVCRLLLEKKK